MGKHDSVAMLAFGVEPGQRAPYQLRQARYYDLGRDCASWAEQQFTKTGQKLDVLDVGTFDGVMRRYAEIHPGAEHLRYHGVDIFPHGEEFVYKHDSWQLHNINLEQGLPGLDSERYDVVVCEQVLEHLHHPDIALADMYRVLRPSGRLVLGVPIFPPPLDLIRKHVVPIADQWLPLKKSRGHVQGWSRGSFLRLVRRACPGIGIERTRGFRIVSGGLLRGLEHQRWWWRFNRRLGRAAPALCIEMQLLATKPASSASRDSQTRRAA